MENRRTRGGPHECDERVNKSVERGSHLLESEIQCRYARARQWKGEDLASIHVAGVKNEWGTRGEIVMGCTVQCCAMDGVVMWMDGKNEMLRLW